MFQIVHQLSQQLYNTRFDREKILFQLVSLLANVLFERIFSFSIFQPSSNLSHEEEEWIIRDNRGESRLSRELRVSISDSHVEEDFEVARQEARYLSSGHLSIRNRDTTAR